MNEKMFRVRYTAAILSLLIVLVLGGVLGYVIPAWAGIHPGDNARLVPVYVDTRGAGKALVNDMGFSEVVKPALPAVVNISSTRLVKPEVNPLVPFNDPFFQQFFGGMMGPMRPRREQALGSGVIVSHDGYILTNNHVVEKGTSIKVYLANKQEYAAKVVGTDPDTDVAVLKINASNLPVLTFADSSKIQIGDYALAIGDPFGIGETVTMGIVSATARNLGSSIENYEDFIQTDAAINPGNSGGALINARGELIGINTAILAGESGGNQGIGFAIPIDMARFVMDQLLKYGKVSRGWMGIVVQDVTAPIAKAYGVPPGQGAIVSDVAPHTPAAEAGLKQGDVIEQLNGQPIKDANDLRLKIGEMRPGTTVHLLVNRAGQKRDVTAKLGEQPKRERAAEATPSGGAAMQEATHGPMVGVEVQTLTPDIRHELGLPPDTHGVVVVGVEPGSAAEAAGLKRGDVIEEVNRHPVTDASEFARQVKQSGNQPLVLLVNRHGISAFVVVEPS